MMTQKSLLVVTFESDREELEKIRKEAKNRSNICLSLVYRSFEGATFFLGQRIGNCPNFNFGKSELKKLTERNIAIRRGYASLGVIIGNLVFNFGKEEAPLAPLKSALQQKGVPFVENNGSPFKRLSRKTGL
ncbi:MAG: hypothetical protein ABEI53_00525 [Candidatus Magasanikbacteria bacterium]